MFSHSLHAIINVASSFPTGNSVELLEFKSVCVMQGAFWGLVFGTVVGIVRMVCDFAYPDPQCDVPDTRPAIIARIHYMYFAIILALITLVTAVIGSILTHGSDRQHVRLFIY